MKIFALMLMLIAFDFVARSQNISGFVKDEQGKALTAVTVNLLSAKDSSLINQSVTDEKGFYQFFNIVAGEYLVEATSIGFQNKYSFKFIISKNKNTDDLILVLQKSITQLSGIVVTSRKPLLEVKADKTILNIDGTINANGTDAFNLMYKLPGLSIDKDENLSLSGKTGVSVFIDGKPSPLTGKDLSGYLKNIPSTQIESIEIITNPSAKYEAEGNAGIINIKLKKIKSRGTNGAVNAEWAEGIFPKYNAGFSINHQENKINIFGNYNYSKNYNFYNLNINRILLDTLFDQHSQSISNDESHLFKAGADYYLNKRNTFGVMVNGNYNHDSYTNYSKTPIVYVINNTIDRVLIANNKNDIRHDNINGNINYTYKDSSLRSISLNADLGHYNIHNNEWQPNYFYDASEKNKLSEVINSIVAPTIIDIQSFKFDFEQSLLKGKISLGGKSSSVKTNNDFQLYNVSGLDENLDKQRSNKFNYAEKINAAYISFNRSFTGIAFQAGLRMENTITEGNSIGLQLKGNNYIPYDSSFRRNYTDLFPNASITFNKNPMNQVSLSYNRRIDRPAYQDLNPFEFKLDEYSYTKGNTLLQPQYTNNFSITNSLYYKLNTSLSFSHITNTLAQLVDTTDKVKSFLIRKNLASQDILSLNVNYPFILKSFTSFVNVNTYQSTYRADFGPGRKININIYNINFYIQNSFKFEKSWTAEVTVYYSSPSIWQGSFRSNEIWTVGTGIQKMVLKGKGTIKASVADVFQSLHWSSVSTFAGQNIHASGSMDTRQFKLSFNYRFGGKELKTSSHSSGLDEENKRVNNNKPGSL